MLAQIPHCLLAAHVGTIMGVETNAMQFYPSASAPEEKVHPGLYRRRGGCIDLSTLSGPGFGYRLNEIARDLPHYMYSYKSKSHRFRWIGHHDRMCVNSTKTSLPEKH
jgi:hypothetical protein